MEKKLERNQQNKMIAGVASGLADYLDVDVTLIRIAFILLVLFGFSGLLLYIILWIVVPEKPFYQNFSNTETDFNKWADSSTTYTTAQQPFSMQKESSNSGRIIAGVVLIAVGTWFMLAELNIITNWFFIMRFWPVLLIILGIAILLKSGKKRRFDFKTEKDASPSPEADKNPEATNESTSNTNEPLA